MKAQVFDIVHRTEYTYGSSVSVSHHLLRLAPRRLPRQACLAHDVELQPAAAAVSRHMDYFGNEVVFATIEGVHQQLVVISRCRVAVGPAFLPDIAETPPWEAIRNLCRNDLSVSALEATEFIFASSHVPVHPAFLEYARPSFPAGRSILEGVADLASRIHGEFRFNAQATTVATPIEEVLAKRQGVCQDFAHLAIACLRSLGLPARYVSGYLETVPPPGKPKLAGADASHAWVAFFCPGIGWIDVDPTNNCFPSMQHVTVGWGRDYADVSPVRGVLLGGGSHALRVGVDVIAQGTTEIAV